MRKAPIIGTATLAALALMLLLNPYSRAGNNDGAKDGGSPPKGAEPKAQPSLLSPADQKLPRDNNYVVHEWARSPRSLVPTASR